MNYETNSVEHKLLQQLGEHLTVTAEAMHEVGKAAKVLSFSLSEFMTDIVGKMAMNDHVRRNGDGWSLTVQGGAALNHLNAKAQALRTSQLSIAAKKTYTPSSGEYNGAELKVVVYRRGAYDFLALPSRFGDQLIQHPTAHLAHEGANYGS